MFTVQTIQGIPDLTISFGPSRTSGSLGTWRKESLDWNNQFPCSQQSKTLSLDITKPYNLLLSENTSKFYIWKTKVYLQNTTVHISHTELNSYFKS